MGFFSVFCTTPDPGYQWESDKLTVRHHKREPRGQEVSLSLSHWYPGPGMVLDCIDS